MMAFRAATDLTESMMRDLQASWSSASISEFDLASVARLAGRLQSTSQAQIGAMQELQDEAAALDRALRAVDDAPTW